MAPQETPSQTDFVANAPLDVFAQIASAKEQNPDAHSFDNIPLPTETSADAQPGGAITLTEALGGPGTSIVRKNVVFLPQSPALEDLDEIMEVQAQMQAQGAKTGKALITLASFVLYVTAGPESDDVLRRATPQEIGRCFSMQDLPLLSNVLQRNINMAENAGPNALVPVAA